MCGMARGNFARRRRRATLMARSRSVTSKGFSRKPRAPASRASVSVVRLPVTMTTLALGLVLERSVVQVRPSMRGMRTSMTMISGCMEAHLSMASWPSVA